MTVSITTAVSAALLGNGATVAFPFSFDVTEVGEVVVYSDGALVSPSAYTVTLAAGNGGTVTFDIAPATGAVIYIASNPYFTQNIGFTNAGPFLPETHDQALDRAAQRDIYLKAQIARAMRVPVGETLDAVLPARAIRAGRHLLFDNPNGNPTAGVSQTEILSLQETVGELIAAIATGNAYFEVDGTAWAASRAAMSVLPATGAALLAEEGRQGLFLWDSSDLSVDVAADTLQGILVAPASDPSGASGAWRRPLKHATVSPFMFGAVGDGVTDDLPALQAFNDWFFSAAHPCYADWTGTFGISGKLTIGPTALVIEGRKYNVGGRPYFKQLTPTFESIRLRFLSGVVWQGSIFVQGLGSTSFASRTCGVGICLETCSRLRIDGLHTIGFWFHGVTYLPLGNSNGAQIGYVRGAEIGSGHSHSGAANSLTGTWSGAVNTGSSGSVSQFTTIDASVLPDPAIETYMPIGFMQVCVRINGAVYYVTAIDRTAGTVSFFPWLDPAAGASGTFEWIFGALHAPLSSNANVVNIGLLDATRCGIAAGEESLYCSTIKSTIIALCGTALMVGGRPSGSSIGLHIDAFYVEGGGSILEQIVVVHRFGNVSNSHYINSTHEVDASKVYMIGDPRATAGNIVGGELGSLTNLTAFPIHHRGVAKTYFKTNIDRGLGSTVQPNGHTRPPIPLILRRDAHTVTLTVKGSGENNRLFGYSGGIIGYIGTGVNGAPTGAFTFTPPAGGTINGGAVGASAVFSTFDGPALFSYEHTDNEQLTWLVKPIGGWRLNGSAVYDPPSIAAGSQASTTVTVEGATLGDAFVPSFNRDLTGLVMTAYVSAVDTVTVSLFNPTIGAIDLASGTLRVFRV